VRSDALRAGISVCRRVPPAAPNPAKSKVTAM
jgi:hypothetical protein